MVASWVKILKKIKPSLVDKPKQQLKKRVSILKYLNTKFSLHLQEVAVAKTILVTFAVEFLSVAVFW